MTGKLTRGISICLCSVLTMSAFMALPTTVFAASNFVSGDKGSGGGKDGGTAGFTTDAYLRYPNKDPDFDTREIQYRDNAGDIHTVTNEYYYKNVMQYSDSEYNLVKSSSVMSSLIDVEATKNNGNQPVYYPADNTSKSIETFVPSSYHPYLSAIKAMINPNSDSGTRHYAKQWLMQGVIAGEIDGTMINYIQRISEVFEFLDDKTKAALSRGEFGATEINDALLKEAEKKKKEAEKKKSDKGKGSSQILPPPDYSCDVGSGDRYKGKATSAEGYGQIKGPYSVYVKVTPLTPSGLSSLSTEQRNYWYKTHKSQSTSPTATAFGSYLDASRSMIRQMRAVGKSGGIGAGSTYRQMWDKFEAEAKAAAKKGVPTIPVVISQANKEGFARGGVMTYTTMVKDATITTTHTQDYYDEYGCVTTYRWIPIRRMVKDKDGDPVRDENGKIKFETVKRKQYYTKYQKIKSNVKIDGQYTSGQGVVVFEGGAYHPDKSYQAVSVRCNLAEFDDLVRRTSSTVIQRGRASSTARTPIKSGGVATAYNRLTADFFYNGKSCNDIFGCTGEPNPSANNDAKNNVANGGDKIGGSFGAQSDGKTGSKFVFFRDNTQKEVRNDVWWLKPNKGASEVSFNNNEPALKTFVILDKNGTPQGDLFTLEGADKKPLIKGTDMASRWYTMLDGQHNKFNWRASWATDAGKPHRMNVIYAYKPSVTSKTLDRMDGNGGSFTPLSYKIDMMCPINMNTSTMVNPNVKNQPKEVDYSPISKFDDSANKSIEVNFVKSSAE